MMWCLIKLSKLLALLVVLVSVKSYASRPCNEVYSDWEGKIMSPEYPSPYPSAYSCSYFLLPPRDKMVLNITVEDLDLGQDQDCLEHTMGSCCTRSWLSLPRDDNKGTRAIAQVCGHNHTLSQRVFTTTIPHRETLHVKFHSLGNHGNGRGFLLKYQFSQLTNIGCEEGQMQCDNGKCVLHDWVCDGIQQCADGKDEFYCDKFAYAFSDYSVGRCHGLHAAECGPLDAGCYNNKTQRCDGHRDCRQSGLDEDGCGGCKKGTLPCTMSHECYHISEACDGTPQCSDYSDEADCGTSNGFCPPGKAECSLQSAKCFSPVTDRCNGKPECPFGEDEIGCDPMCENSIACADGQGCYTPAERCNLLMNCADGSDELHCQRELHFECQTGGTTISVRLWCDGVDDCGDGSDERGCLKNSVITAAIMGSLLCGLLLVVAVGCTCRLYSLSMKGLGGSASNNSSSPHHLASPDIAPAPPSSPRHDVTPITCFPGDEEFYFREPPPAYSVAVGECPPSPCPPYAYSGPSPTQPRIHAVLPGCERIIARSGSRRSRRSGGHIRRHSLTPPRSFAGQPPAQSVPLPLPSYSTAMLRSLQLPLPPYSPPADPSSSSPAEASLPEFAPPPSLKVMESLLQSIEREVDAGSTAECAESASDVDALVTACPGPGPDLSPGPTPAECHPVGRHQSHSRSQSPPRACSRARSEEPSPAPSLSSSLESIPV